MRTRPNKVIVSYQNLATKAEAQSSVLWKALGGAMMALATIISLLGSVVIISTLGAAAVIPAVRAMAKGAGFFEKGHQCCKAGDELKQKMTALEKAVNDTSRH